MISGLHEGISTSKYFFSFLHLNPKDKNIFCASFIFIGKFIVEPLINNDLRTINIYADLEKEAKIEMEFLETNYEEFDDLSLNTLSDSYKNEYFMMETPRGIVYMCYDKELNTFNFYCNKKEIPNSK